MIKQVNVKSYIKYWGGKFISRIHVRKFEDAVREAEIISFDLFDTLVKRNVVKPEHVHELVERGQIQFFIYSIAAFIQYLPDRILVQIPVLYPECEIEQAYLYVSRQALTVPQLADAADFDEMAGIFRCIIFDVKTDHPLSLRLFSSNILITLAVRQPAVHLCPSFLEARNHL